MDGINFEKDDLLTVSSRENIFNISYYKQSSDFVQLEEYVKFIKGCEKIVRKSPRYTQFVSEMFSCGLTRCSVLGHIENYEDDNSITIEMHHGPILTLFDYCAIMTEYRLQLQLPVNTFIIGNEVLNEHFEGNVQVVMLSKTVHQLVDSGKLFIHFNQARGNLQRFLEKYKLGITDDQVKKINKYIELSYKFDTFDNGLLDMRNTITNWDYAEAKSRIALLNQ